MKKTLNTIIKFSLYSLIFLLPVFFLPFSFEAYEFNKQYLLFFLVSLAFLAWFAKMIICDKEIKFRRTPLNIPILVFIFIAILNTVFSIDRISSLFGFYGRFSDNLIGILSFGALYFLITNNASTNKGQKTINNKDKEEIASHPLLTVDSSLKAFLWSVFFVLLFSYFSLFGVWQLLSKLAPKFQLLAMLGRTFNPAGAYLEALAVFLATVAILLVALILIRSKENIIKNSILLTASFLLLLIINFTPVWLVLVLTLIIFLVFAFWSRIFKEKINLLLVPIVLIIISTVFIFFKPSTSYKISISGFDILNPKKEILLDQGTTWKVAIETVKKYPVLGSGIATFSYDFSKFKPAEFNQTNLWQIRFDKAGNQAAEVLATQGVLGFLSWLAIIGIFLLISWFFLETKITKIKTQNEKEVKDNYQLPLFFFFLALFLSQFVYYQNTTLAFTFWLVLGLSVASWNPSGETPKEKGVSFKDFPEMSLVFNIVLILLFLIISGSWFFAVRFYLADINYKNGIISGKTENFEKAVNLNKLLSIYRISLSRAYFTDASNEVQKPPEAQDAKKIQNDLAQAIDQAKTVGKISPNWVVSFENLGMIYRDLRVFAQGAEQFAIDSFQKAAELEPTNPVFPTESGKILLNEGKTDEAKKAIENTLELKPDYLDAQIQSALVSEAEGNFQDAISKLEGIAAQNSSNVEVFFQLGRVYYNNNQTDKAVSSLRRAISLSPNHSNSLYALGVAYQKNGQKEEALKMFEKVLKLNPGNQDVIAKIAELKSPAPTPAPTLTPTPAEKK